MKMGIDQNWRTGIYGFTTAMTSIITFWLYINFDIAIIPIALGFIIVLTAKPITKWIIKGTI